jgi:hypothetical protein
MALAAGLASAQEPQTLFTANGEFGALWVNATLTQLRIEEPFLPMVIGVQNLGSDSVSIDRGSIRLIGPDGTRYPVADLKEVRKGYEKLRLDHRIASAAGIPVNVWYRQSRLREANFFPDIGGRGGTVIDRVVLRRNDAMVDLVYFRRPPALIVGSPFVIEVAPEGWETPTRLGMRIQ